MIQGHYWQYLDENVNPPLPAKPLTSAPGTLERVQELHERAARGEHLWHPEDRSTLGGFTGDLFAQSFFGQGQRKYRREDVGGRGGTYFKWKE